MKKRTRKVTAPRAKKSSYKFHPAHGMAAGVLLILLKGILGIAAVVGIAILIVSSVFYAKKTLLKSR